MIKIGKINRLTVVKQMEFGVFLDGGKDWGNVLLPKRYLTNPIEIGQEIDVFIYFDSEDQIIATTEKALAEVGSFAKLACVETNSVGAFLNWGLAKDLLVPFSEQRTKMQIGKDYVVFLYVDKASGRIVATTKWNKWLDKTKPNYRVNQKVSVIVLEQTDLGYKCAIENEHSGLIFKSEMFGKIFIGKRLYAYIKQIRQDGKIDLSLQQKGLEKVDVLADKILELLKKKQGFLPVGDKSSPEEIFALFRTSKATFKKTIGSLYKQQKIRIGSDGLYLIK